MNKKLLPLLLFIFVSLVVKSQISITNINTAYTQDFNTLANTGTSSTTPLGWLFAETGSSNNTTYTAGIGSSNTGDTYSFGAAASTERAFGGQLSGNLTPTIGAHFTNNTGATITSITINYTGEQWRLGATGRADSLNFQYSINATTLLTGTWIDENNLDFIAPITTGTAGALDGNLSANQAIIAAFTITGLSINNGGDFWIRWNDFNATGADDGLGVDDFTITFNGVALPACTEPNNQPTSLNLNPSINSISGDFTAATPTVDGYLIVRSLSSSLTINPADGTPYTAGQTLGNGTIVNSAASTSFTDNGLSSNTTYYYFIFAYNSVSCSGGPNYLIVDALSNSTTTLSLPTCTTPIAPPTGLLLTPAPTSISGSFIAEPSANRYLVVYSLNSSLGFTPVNGTTYTAGQVIGADKVVSYGSTTSFIITGLNSITTYYIFVFSANGNCTGEPFYNTTSLDGSATTTNSGIPAGYYDAAAGLSCQNLKTALRNIIANGHIPLNYSTIDNVEIPAVDTVRSDDALRSIIWDVYSNNNVGPEPFELNSSQSPTGGFCGGSSPGNEGVCWNKEHTFPRSWFKLSGSSYQQPTEADLFLVRATDAKLNSNRGNIPYSTTGSPTYQFPTAGAYPGYPMPPNPVLVKIGPSNYPGVTASSAFEPSDAVKGDIARGYFYILTRYQNELSNWTSLNSATSLTTVADGTTNGGLYPSFQLSYLQMMYAWNNLDPVDAKEINRNNLVFSQQSNRNPYIDHPEYVVAVWQCTGVLPVTVTDFTAQKNNESVILNWYATFETNFKKYEIERSINGNSFYTIGEVAGRNLANYSFTDNNLPSANTVYYRLKMIDIDGKFSNSKTVAVRIGGNFSNALVYPNPTKEKLTIKLQQPLTEKSSLLITDISGRIVLQQQVVSGQRNIDVHVQQLPAGRYFIKISNHNEMINQSFVIIK